MLTLPIRSIRAHPPALFDFDWFGQTFPTLCLRCLPKPATISSSIPISSNSSWPTSPPGSVQLDALRQRLDFTLQHWRKQIILSKRNNDTKPLNDTDGVVEEEQPYHEHLNNAFSTWMSLPDSRKQEIWHLESLRALAREQQNHAETQLKVQRLEQEAAHLRAQLDRLSDCQQPREFLLYPPTTLPLSRKAADAMSEITSSKDWDADALLEKWTFRLRSHRGIQKPLPDLEQEPSTAAVAPMHSTNNGSSAGGKVFQAQPTTNGHVPSYTLGQQPGDEDVSDSDLMDAPGEEDEDIAGQNGELAGLLDPKLRERRGDMMQGVESSFGGRVRS